MALNTQHCFSFLLRLGELHNLAMQWEQYEIYNKHGHKTELWKQWNKNYIWLDIRNAKTTLQKLENNAVKSRYAYKE